MNLDFHVSMTAHILEAGPRPIGIMDPSSVPCLPVDGGKHYYIWPPLVKRVRVFPVIGSGSASSSSSAVVTLAICDKRVVFDDVANEGHGLVEGDEGTPAKSELDAALEQLAAFVDESAPDPERGGDADPALTEDPFSYDEADGSLFGSAPPKQFFGKFPAAVVGMFPNGRIGYYATDGRFECTCFLHQGCVLTRSAKNRPLAFLHWWLSHASAEGCSSKAAHWCDKYISPDENLINKWAKAQLLAADPMYVDLHIAQIA